MSLTQQASDPENMQVKITSSDKQSKNGDEQIEGMSLSDGPEFTDPAILVVRELAKICYTKEELVNLRDTPLSKNKPDFPDDVSPSILDPERWNVDNKKSATPTENGARGSGDGSDYRRRPGDPRERIRKENDGIVLSPQRRSFNSGCFVPVRGDSTRSNRSHSPLGGKNEPSHLGLREIQPGARRIGSGRILRDSWDFNEKTGESGSGDNDYSYGRGQQQQRGNEREDKFGDKYERRSFGRDFDIGRDRENNNNKEGRRNGRYERRRISEHREQEEPEWFSGGPVSQHDTIELRGFDEADKPGKKRLSLSRVKRAVEWKKKNETPTSAADEKEDPKRSTPVPQVGSESEQSDKKQTEEKKPEESSDIKAKGEEKENNKAGSVVNDQSFNLDEFLKCDDIPGLLTNGAGGDGDNTKSRFSRWFKQESPEKQESSRRSSVHEDHHIIKDLLKDIGETSVTIPGDSEAYFAPISPAGNTSGIIGGKRGAQQQSQQSINIMEMLQRGKQQSDGGNAKQSQMPGKILNLDELEAKMRQNAIATSALPQKHQQQKSDDEIPAAFKKLLAQAQAGTRSSTSNGPMNKSQPMSLLEMLNHSQQQDEAARLSGTNAHLLGPASPNIGLHHHHPANDLTLKLQQAQLQKQQMEMLNKLINATPAVHPQQMRTSPLHDMGMQQSRELLNRPEAQAILQGLKRGEITTQHLYQQLANPALQPRHREMLHTILKLQGGGGGGYGHSPRVLSPVPSHHMFQQQQQQQLRVSPLPPNAMHQRIPSPRELQVHTQNILQRALIKKKLEEQQENYRKKQEMQRGHSPSTSAAQGTKSVASPTPLAFTPTSVLRKMTADKDEGKENKATADGKVPPGRPLTGMRTLPQLPQEWNPQYASLKQRAGRPIVKANNNYQTQTPEQFFSQQQQRMFNQGAPALAAAAAAVAQQQRKPLSSQFGSGQAPSGGVQSQYSPQQYSTNQQFAQQLTQQQLRAQHQHRPANQQQTLSQPPQQQQQSHQQMGFQQQQQGGQQQLGMGGAATWQQFFSNAQQANRTAVPLGRSGLNDGDLSPTTSNQLARWFSPDLLERARGGELPSTAGLGQHARSLEEIERQTAPPVHN